MMNGQEYKVSIYGDLYTLKSDEPGERIVQAATMVDSMMKEMAGGSHVDAKNLAVLTALILANKLLAQKQYADGTHDEKIINFIDQELCALGIVSSL